jgi:hypothetical protein
VPKSKKGPPSKRVAAAPFVAPSGPASEPAVPPKQGATSPAAAPVSEDQVRLCAYLKWEAAGRPVGDGACFWLEAERELCGR